MGDDQESVSAASFVPLSRAQTAPGTLRKERVYMNPEEMYKVTRGLTTEWGVEGYEVTKKSATYKRKDFRFPKSARNTFISVSAKFTLMQYRGPTTRPLRAIPRRPPHCRSQYLLLRHSQSIQAL